MSTPAISQAVNNNRTALLTSSFYCAIVAGQKSCHYNGLFKSNSYGVDWKVDAAFPIRATLEGQAKVTFGVSFGDSLKHFSHIFIFGLKLWDSQATFINAPWLYNSVCRIAFVFEQIITVPGSVFFDIESYIFSAVRTVVFNFYTNDIRHLQTRVQNSSSYLNLVFLPLPVVVTRAKAYACNHGNNKQANNTASNYPDCLGNYSSKFIHNSLPFLIEQNEDQRVNRTLLTYKFFRGSISLEDQKPPKAVVTLSYVAFFVPNAQGNLALYGERVVNKIPFGGISPLFFWEFLTSRHQGGFSKGLFGGAFQCQQKRPKMSTDLTVSNYYFNEHSMRVVNDASDKLWFVLADVARVLGLSNPRSSVAKLSDKHKLCVHSVDGQFGKMARKVLLISEAGFYKTALQSRKPNADTLVDWVCEQVLPSIRKTGGYIAPNTAPQAALPNSEDKFEAMQRKRAVEILDAHMDAIEVFEDALHGKCSDRAFSNVCDQLLARAAELRMPYAREEIRDVQFRTLLRMFSQSKTPYIRYHMRQMLADLPETPLYRQKQTELEAA